MADIRFEDMSNVSYSSANIQDAVTSIRAKITDIKNSYNGEGSNLGIKKYWENIVTNGFEGNIKEQLQAISIDTDITKITDEIEKLCQDFEILDKEWRTVSDNISTAITNYTNNNPTQ